MYTMDLTLQHSIVQSEILGRPLAEVADRVAPMFLCDGEGKMRLDDLIGNSVFSAIRSAKQAAIYGRYVDSFCSNASAFGKADTERAVLDIKERAYEFLDALIQDSDNVAHDAVSALAKKQGTAADSYGEYQTVYALTLYLQGKGKETVVPSLIGALKNGSVAAGLMLLYIETDEERRQALYSRLKNIPEYKLRLGLDDIVRSVYNICTDKTKRGNFLGIIGGDHD